MRRIVLLVLLGLLGFYVAMPAWSGWRLHQALQNRDPRTLEAVVDFPSVRESLRPTVTQLVETRLDQQIKQSGGGLGNILGGDIKAQLVPRITTQALATIVTPENVIRIVAEGANAAALQKVVMEKIGEISQGLPGAGGGAGSGGAQLPGGLGQILGQVGVPGFGGRQQPQPSPAPTPSPAPAAGDAKPASFGLGNIKGISFDGPLAFAVSVARDATSPKADFTAGMAFKDLTWKVTKLVPNL
jgi:hypothetical protein